MIRKKYTAMWFFIFFVFFLGITFFAAKFLSVPQTVISPITETLEHIGIHPYEVIDGSLETVVEHALKDAKGTYGIVIQNLKTGETYESNEHEVFQSGSLYKLWVMATAYDQIKNGVLRENDIMKQEIPILNEKFKIATEDAELTEGDITLSVTDALFQMITISDNYAALLLSEKIRLSRVAQFLSKNGFTLSKVGTDGSIPTTTASDIASFFEKLYKGTLIDTEYDEKMLDLLKSQELNNKIPKNLPQGIIIAHKTGEFNLFTHDAGIVYTPKGDYIIVILSESKDPLEAEQLIANISESVYHYFTSGMSTTN
ncbi:class A beta-lactamase-related serine hydrolase [Patescibacteria group bacterium]|nr:class A beta-lactamase-related serine hydrolase [Patescibacteria group bacterium]